MIAPKAMAALRGKECETVSDAALTAEPSKGRHVLFVFELLH